MFRGHFWTASAAYFSSIYSTLQGDLPVKEAKIPIFRVIWFALNLMKNSVISSNSMISMILCFSLKSIFSCFFFAFTIAFQTSFRAYFIQLCFRVN